MKNSKHEPTANYQTRLQDPVDPVRIELEVRVERSIERMSEDRTRFHLFAAGQYTASYFVQRKCWTPGDRLFIRLLCSFPLGIGEPSEDVALMNAFADQWPQDDALKRQLIAVLIEYQDEQSRQKLLGRLSYLGGVLEASGDALPVLSLLWAPCAMNVAARRPPGDSDRDEILGRVERILTRIVNLSPGVELKPLTYHLLGFAARLKNESDTCRARWTDLANLGLEGAEDSPSEKAIAQANRELKTSARINLKLHEFAVAAADVIRKPLLEILPVLDNHGELVLPGYGERQSRRLAEVSCSKWFKIVVRIEEVIKQRNEKLNRAARDLVDVCRQTLSSETLPSDVQDLLRRYQGMASCVLGEGVREATMIKEQFGPGWWPREDHYARYMMNDYWTPEFVWLDFYRVSQCCGNS